MSTPVANLKVKMDGEKEFKDALSSIQSSFKLLDSEMTLIKAKYQDNMDTTEALTEVHDVLSKKIEAQTRRVAELQAATAEAENTQAAATAKFEELAAGLDKDSDAYKALAAQLEKTKKNTENWQAQLNRAQAALYDLDHELSENEQALEDAQKSGDEYSSVLDRIKRAFSDAKEEGTGATGVFKNLREEFGKGETTNKSLADSIQDITKELGVELPPGADGALEALAGFSTGKLTAIAGFAALAGAIVQAEQALIDLTNESAERAKDIETLASITGQSTEEVQQMEYASEKLGVSYDRVKDSLKEITNKMQEAENGSEDTAEAFKKLGVELRDSNGELRDAQDVFLDVVDALGEVGNQSERDALAMDLMSESAQELNPMIEAGRAQIEQYMQAASDMGYVLEEDELAALTDVQSAFYDLQQQQEATKNHLAAEFAPYLTSFYSDMGEATSAFGAVLEDSGIVSAFGALLEFVGELIDPTNTLAGSALPALETALAGVALVLAVVVDSLRAIVELGDGIADLIDTGDSTTLKNAFSFSATKAVVGSWGSGSSSRGSFSSGSSSGGFGSTTVNNYYSVSGANSKSVAQIEKQAQSARQTNRSYGGA